MSAAKKHNEVELNALLQQLQAWTQEGVVSAEQQSVLQDGILRLASSRSASTGRVSPSTQASVPSPPLRGVQLRSLPSSSSQRAHAGSSYSVGSMSVAVDDASVYSHGDSASHTISDLHAAGEGGEGGVDDNSSGHALRGDDEGTSGTRDASLGRDDEVSSMYPATAGSVRSAPVEDESSESAAGAGLSRFALPSSLLAGGALDVVGEEVGSAGASAGGSEGHTADHGGISMAGSDDEDGEQGGAGGLHGDDEDDDDGDGELDEDDDGEDAVAGASVAVRPPRRRRGGGAAPARATRAASDELDRGTPPTFDDNGDTDHQGDEEEAGGDGDSAAAAARGGARGVYGDDVHPEDHEEEGEDMGASDLKGGAFVTFAAEADVMGHPHELQGGGGDMGAADQPGRAFEEGDSDGASQHSDGSNMQDENEGGVSGLQDCQISLGTMGNRSEPQDTGSAAGTSVGRVEGGSVLWADLVGTVDAVEGGGHVDLSPLPDGMEEPAQAMDSVRSADGDGPTRDARSDGGSSSAAVGGVPPRKVTGSPAGLRMGSAASDVSTVRSNLTGLTRDPRAPVHSARMGGLHAALGAGRHAPPSEPTPYGSAAPRYGHPVHSDVDDDDDEEDDDGRHSFAAVASMGERAFTDQNHDGDSDSGSDGSQGQGHLTGQRRGRSGQRHTALGDTPLEAYDETKVLWRNHMSSNASTTALAEDRDFEGPLSQMGGGGRHRAEEPQQNAGLPPRAALVRPAQSAYSSVRVPSTHGSPTYTPRAPSVGGSPLLALRSVLQFRPDALPPTLPCTPDGEPNIWGADDGNSMDSAGAEALAAALAASHAGATRMGSSSGGAASSMAESGSRPSSAQSAPTKPANGAAGRPVASAPGAGATIPARRPTSAVARSHHKAGTGATSSRGGKQSNGRPSGANARPASATVRPGTASHRPRSANASPKRRNKGVRASSEDEFAVAHAVRAASRRPEASSRMQRLHHLVQTDRTAAHRRAFDREFDAEIPEMD